MFVVIWILFGLVSAVVASSRGANGCLYAFLGVLLGPFGLILAFVASPSTTDTPPAAAPPQIAPPVPPGPVSIGDELAKLRGLLDQGVLTQEEFDEQKRRLLS